MKLDSERPPAGFDSLVAMNPVARWFNLNTSCWVHPAEIVFHELAEAYAKLEFGLDYLDQGSRLGAHAVALVREQRLRSQRPGRGHRDHYGFKPPAAHRSGDSIVHSRGKRWH